MQQMRPREEENGLSLNNRKINHTFCIQLLVEVRSSFWIDVINKNIANSNGVGPSNTMFGFKKKSIFTEPLFINILIFGTLFSWVVQVIYSSLPLTNKLVIKNSKEGGLVLDVSDRFNGTSACGRLGCFKMRETTFLTGENVPGWIDGPGNLTVNYTSDVQLSCKPKNNDSSAIYWIGTRNITKKGANFTMDGYFYKNDPTVDKKYQLTLVNVTGYEYRWFACIMVQNNTAAIAYGFLNVTGDPDKSHYSSERYENLHSGDKDNLTYQGVSSLTAGLIAVALMFLLAITSIIGITVYKRRINSMIVKYWLKKVTVEIPLSETGELVMPIVSIEKQRLTQVGIKGNDTTLMSEYQMPVDAQWEIPRSKISLTGKVLGEGEFGKVVQAEVHGLVTEDVKTVVAIKMLKDGYTDADMKALVSEMTIMKLIGKHENIINLLGCCTQDGPLYVVVELATNGCLRSYLKQHKPPTNNGSSENLLKKTLKQRDLMDFVWQVAKGMEYLASRGCIHRDLAARNVLVSADGILKIADFGLARDVRDSEYYRKRVAGRLPVKWMAPESMAQNYFDRRSDVWSFGIITWEIMTYGEVPYAKISVYKLYNYLETNNRLEKPDKCSNEVYDLMKDCWAFNPADRPTFEKIVDRMCAILKLPNNRPPKTKQNDYVTMLA